jgi:hypothetical protein
MKRLFEDYDDNLNSKTKKLHRDHINNQKSISSEIYDKYKYILKLDEDEYEYDENDKIGYNENYCYSNENMDIFTITIIHDIIKFDFELQTNILEEIYAEHYKWNTGKFYIFCIEKPSQYVIYRGEILSNSSGDEKYLEILKNKMIIYTDYNQFNQKDNFKGYKIKWKKIFIKDLN